MQIYHTGATWWVFLGTFSSSASLLALLLHRHSKGRQFVALGTLLWPKGSTSHLSFSRPPAMQCRKQSCVWVDCSGSAWGCTEMPFCSKGASGTDGAHEKMKAYLCTVWNWPQAGALRDWELPCIKRGTKNRVKQGCIFTSSFWYLSLLFNSFLDYWWCAQLGTLTTEGTVTDLTLVSQLAKHHVNAALDSANAPPPERAQSWPAGTKR